MRGRRCGSRARRYVTLELRNNPDKCNIEQLKKALKEQWKKPVADYMYEVSEESKDMTTMAQALCNKRGTTVAELHRVLEMLLVARFPRLKIF
jgi:spore coat polysaccharide biosynthesis protein SpsF (cytidylyltransferase family)